jgi:Bifunctional DNA primase/polymerase, N-terminal
MAISSTDTLTTVDFSGPLPKWESPLDAALFYAERGMKILPSHYVKEDKKGNPLSEEDWKKPPLDGWPSGATTDEEQIKKWWKRWPDALIGHRPGDSGCVVFDIDMKDGKDGEKEWRSLGFNNFRTMEAETRNGGSHIWALKADFDVSNSDIAPGINVRGDNGYVILPSPGSGYEWEQWGPPRPMPPKLTELLRSVQPENHTGAAEDDELPPREDFDAALRKWRGRIRAKRAWWKEHLRRRWGVSDKTGERSDVLHRMEHDCCELGISEKDCFLLIWPLDICKFRCDGRRQGERQLRREISEVYAGHQTKQGENGPKFGTLSDVVEEDVRYLWKPYIHYGMVVIFERDPKAGKSYVAMWIAARLSVGWTCPAFVESVFDFTLPALRTEAG